MATKSSVINLILFMFINITLQTGLSAQGTTDQVLPVNNEKIVIDNLQQKNTQNEIKIIPGDGMNLAIERVVNPYYIEVKLTSPVHNWFAGQFNNLPVDKEFSIELSINDINPSGNKGDVSKWKGLKPVMTYGDPTKYEMYVWYSKDDKGRWVSGDPFKKGDEKFAGTGKVPEQNAIPKEVAEDFLSKDGNYWQPWCEIDNTESLLGPNVFCMKQKFKLSTATLAMRIPYTYTYQQEFIKQLKAVNIPGVFVDEIGETPEKKKIQVIRVETPGESVGERPTILVYAREHGTEHDSSNAVAGILKWLLSGSIDANDAIKHNCWLIIPILDVDASVTSAFRSGDFFRGIQPYMPEAIAYATYIVNWVDQGHRLDMAINTLNIECAEGTNLESPFINAVRYNAIVGINKSLFTRVAKLGFTTGVPAGWGGKGVAGDRFYGWCFRYFNALELAFELNSRAPQSRLSQQRTEELGSAIAKYAVDFINSPEYSNIRKEIDQFMIERKRNREEWWKRMGRDASKRTLGDLFVGY